MSLSVWSFPVWGSHDEKTLMQMENAVRSGPVYKAALHADGHVGYAVPIGSVLAYRDAVSPEAVGVDIGCGNKAVRTEATMEDLLELAGADTIKPIMNKIFRKVSFGIGRRNPDPIDHELFDYDHWDAIPPMHREKLRSMAREQFGTVGGGNHYVDLLVEDTDERRVWIACHFGSRGLGFHIANGFINLAKGRDWSSQAREDMMRPPSVISLESALGSDYWMAMKLACFYAYAGRDYVIDQVLQILGNPKVLIEVHNNHNDARLERHGDDFHVVVRKGATSLFPDQLGFIGGSMGDISVIVQGLDTEENRRALRSSIHGAGRVMSRTQAAGKWKKIDGKRVRVGGEIDFDRVRRDLWNKGIVIKGAGADEAPGVYRKLDDVLSYYTNAWKVLYRLYPIGVAMAPDDEFDPYKD